MKPIQRIFASFGFRPSSFIALGVAAAISNVSLSGTVLPAASARATTVSSCSALFKLPFVCPTPAPAASQNLQVSVPDGANQCADTPSAAACFDTKLADTKIGPGTASTPTGLSACGTTGQLTSFAACSDERGVLSGADSALKVDLSANALLVRPGASIVLTATSNDSVTGTNKAIEIFDQTTGKVIGACGRGGQCSVAYAAPSGIHSFVAYVMSPQPNLPATGSFDATSTRVAVSWMHIDLTALNPITGPGKPITITATSPLDASSSYPLQVFDLTTNQRLTFCVHGNSCSFSINQGWSGARSVVAAIATPTLSWPVSDARAQSDTINATWVGASISASSAWALGSQVTLTATSNADLSHTPWSLVIFDNQGHLVGKPCKNGSTCSTVVSIPAGSNLSFNAVIGRVTHASGVVGSLGQRIAPSTPVDDVQSRTQGIVPDRLLWGVDSCKLFTEDSHATTGIYPQVAGAVGAPDFWGRYMTNTICPGISADEVYAAHNIHMGILPIYNDYDCSNVSGYDTGKQYAAAAVAAAHRLAIPQGRGLAIDIEPPGDACPGAANIDTGFIHGWYDGITDNNYSAIFYGDATPGSAFATQWCYTVEALPYIGQHSYLWSFQPSLMGAYARSNAPWYSPHLTGCLGYVHAWQYQLGSQSVDADVDHDEATSILPLWFP